MPMHPNAALIERFYGCFQARDGRGMMACYHPEASFSDPVFPDLKAADVGRMWRMLAGSAKDLTVTFGDIEADDQTGRAKWRATYLFSATGRRVINRVEARFTFQDGLIYTHQDRFCFWRWSSQALGPAGVLLGWNSALKHKVQAQAAGRLAQFKG